MLYKVTFYFRTPVLQTQPPMFDGLLAKLWVLENLPPEQHGRKNIPVNEIIDFSDKLPIVYKNGIPQASEMFWHKDQSVNDIVRYRKKWEQRYDHLANFGKKKAQVSVMRGEFKSYDIPYQATAMLLAWFYFESENINEVERMLHLLNGIGKKANIGGGEIKKFEIETTDEVSFDTDILRPIPIRLRPDIVRKIQFRAWKPPYWLPENMEACYVP